MVPFLSAHGREHYAGSGSKPTCTVLYDTLESRPPVRVEIGLPTRSSYVVTGPPNPSGSNAEGTKAMAQEITAEKDHCGSDSLCDSHWAGPGDSG